MSVMYISCTVLQVVLPGLSVGQVGQCRLKAASWQGQTWAGQRQNGLPLLLGLMEKCLAHGPAPHTQSGAPSRSSALRLPVTGKQIQGEAPIGQQSNHMPPEDRHLRAFRQQLSWRFHTLTHLQLSW